MKPILTILLFIPLCLPAQQQKPLSVGDTLPAAAWQYLSPFFPSPPAETDEAKKHISLPPLFVPPWGTTGGPVPGLEVKNLPSLPPLHLNKIFLFPSPLFAEKVSQAFRPETDEVKNHFSHPPLHLNKIFLFPSPLFAEKVSQAFRPETDEVEEGPGGEAGERLLLLNFMSTGCISCLQALPKIDTLQQQFGFAMILVTPDKKQRIASFLQKNPIGKSIHYPLIPEDSILKQYFPHEFISHIAWIYRGRVAAITGSEYITAGNMETLLSGKKLSLPVKTDRADYDYTASLLPQPRVNNTVSAAWLSSMPGVPRRFLQGTDSAAAIRWFRFINYPVLDIYYRSYGISLHGSKEQLQLCVADTARFIYDKTKAFREEWKAANTFCYEIAFPLSTPLGDCWQWIRNDLDKRLKLHSRLIQSEKPILIITEQ